MRDRVMLGLMAALAAAILTAPVSRLHAGETSTAPAPPRSAASVCASWKEAASRTIAQLAQAGPDVNVLRISDSIAGMRRADRLCALGFLVSACREYDAIMRGIPSRLHVGPMPQMCQSVPRDEPASW
jgi:hypothetical protein